MQTFSAQLHQESRGCVSSDHVVFEDSLDHRREDFDHDHGARPLATVLQDTAVVRGQKDAVCAPLSATSPCRRTRTGQEGGGCFPGEERWPKHKHTRIFPCLICCLLREGGRATDQSDDTGELHKPHDLV